MSIWVKTFINEPQWKSHIPGSHTLLRILVLYAGPCFAAQIHLNQHLLGKEVEGKCAGYIVRKTVQRSLNLNEMYWWISVGLSGILKKLKWKKSFSVLDQNEIRGNWSTMHKEITTSDRYLHKAEAMLILGADHTGTDITQGLLLLKSMGDFLLTLAATGWDPQASQLKAQVPSVLQQRACSKDPQLILAKPTYIRSGVSIQFHLQDMIITRHNCRGK